MTNTYVDQAVKNNIYTGTTVDQKTGIPSGTKIPGSILMPVKDGGMSSFTLMKAEGNLTAQAEAGLNLEASLSASGDLQANLGLILNLLANLSASGNLTTAQLGAVADMTANLTASGTFTTAQLGAIIDLSAELSASGSLNGFCTSLANMVANIGGAEPLSPQGLATALLDNSDIESGYSMREILKLLSAAMAGKLSGAPGTTITIKNVNDNKNRIVATVDANGNRTSVIYDVSD